MFGAVLLAATAVAAHPAPTIKAKIPVPGGIELRVLRIEETLGGLGLLAVAEKP